MTAAKPAPGQGPKLTVIDNAPAGSPGQRLSRARSQRNLSHEDVAKHLNLSVSMVKAIESDNFKSLPGRAFVKGYLRNYGKLVGIAPDELVKAFESQFANNEDVVLTPPPVSRPLLRWVGPLIKGVGYLLVLAIVALIGSVIYQNAGTLMQKVSQVANSFHHSDAPSPPAAEAPQEAAEVSDTNTPGTVKLAIPLRSVESPQQEIVAPIENTDSNAVGERPASGEGLPSSEKKDGNDAVPLVTPQSSSDNGALVNSPVEVAAPGATVAASAASLQSAESGTISNSGTVGMAFSKSSYVEIKDARGKYLFKGLKTGGSDLQLQGKPPLKVLVGYGPGVKVSFNGKPYEFSVSAGNNVAQFTLGDE